MEKLRELLNSYEEYKEKETWYSNYDWRLNEINDEEEHEQWITAFRVDDSQLWVEESIAVIICRWYCFIEWLVENDKIDKKKIDTRLVRNVESHYDEEWYWVENSYEDYSEIDTLLMLLAISDTPIEDLVSYLK